ncbi:hypothetical protein OS189_17865 [Sulfitobacter sp. F26169L]|uniref:hypothetical protein n=1 Tax=Sulfitobacter sp. F26169L TaxID=2996015 RepID=UPI002260C126|nr:hypothetical protein [Sulfitobacter sp. F26169L]MCX7568212.1 hypothetical protein [Sulfitobacter sp. F26169L]
MGLPILNPDEFSFNGANGKKPTGNDKQKATGIRLLDKPCKGKKGARFTVSLNHVRQQDSRENTNILKHLANDASINGLKWLLSSGGRKASVRTIYNRNFGLKKPYWPMRKGNSCNGVLKTPDPKSRNTPELLTMVLLSELTGKHLEIEE